MITAEWAGYSGEISGEDTGMDLEKAKDIVERDLVAICTKQKWSAKDAGRLIANVIIANYVGATVPPIWQKYSHEVASMMAGVAKDERTAHFTDNQFETINDYADIGAYGVTFANNSLIWSGRALNALKDAEIELRRPFVIMLNRLVGYDDDTELIPLEITAGKAKGEYADAIVTEYIRKRRENCQSAYDAAIKPMSDVLTWNIFATRIADAYGLEAFASLQLGEMMYVRKQILDVRDVLERLAKLCEPRRTEIASLFDVQRLLTAFDKYNALDGKSVELQCEKHFSLLLKSYRIRPASLAITEEIQAYVRK